MRHKTENGADKNQRHFRCMIDIVLYCFFSTTAERAGM